MGEVECDICGQVLPGGTGAPELAFHKENLHPYIFKNAKTILWEEEEEEDVEEEDGEEGTSNEGEDKDRSMDAGDDAEGENGDR